MCHPKCNQNGYDWVSPNKINKMLNHDDALGKSPILFIIPHEFSENVPEIKQKYESQGQSNRFRFNDTIS